MSKSEKLTDLLDGVKKVRRSNQNEDFLSSVKVLQQVASKATKSAQQSAKSKGVPYVISRRSQFIKVYPDGSEKVIEVKLSNAAI